MGETGNQPRGNRSFLPKRDLAGDVDYIAHGLAAAAFGMLKGKMRRKPVP